MEWNKNNTTLLIEFFKQKRELWDSTSVDFKDRSKKQEAWKDLADKFNTDKNVVEKKMRSLIGQFQRECKKSRSEITSKWFGFQLLSFLRDKNRTTSTSEIGVPENNLQEAPPKKKTKVTYDNLNAQKEACDRMKEMHTGRQPRDDFSVFGEHIACRMRNLRDPLVICTIQNQIHNILFQAEIGLYGGQSSSFHDGFYPGEVQYDGSGAIQSPSADTDTSQNSEDMDDILINMQQSQK